MKVSYTLLFIFILPFIDLIGEIIHQSRFLTSFESILVKFENANRILTDRGIIKHNTEEAIKHLCVAVFLVFLSTFILMVTIRPNLRTFLISKFKSYRIHVESFMGVSSFEMTLLCTQTSFIRFFESRWIFDLFITNNILRYLWLPTVLFIIAPLEARFKIFMEVKFHEFSNLAIGLVHYICFLLFPSFIFYYYLLFFKLHKININSTNLMLLKDLNLYFLQQSYNTPSLMIFPTLFSNNFIAKKIDQSNPDLLLSAILLDLYKVRCKRILFLFPFLSNLLFSFIIFIVKGSFLNSLCTNDIHHVCAQLILEEYINISWFKYFLIPFNLGVRDMIVENDLKLVELLKSFGNPERKHFIHKLSEAILIKMENHEIGFPSSIHRLLYNSSNLIERLENIILNLNK